MVLLVITSDLEGCIPKITLNLLKAYPLDTIVLYDSSLWQVQLCHKNTIPTCYSLPDVANGSEDSHDWIGYIKTNNHIQHVYNSCIV